MRDRSLTAVTSLLTACVLTIGLVPETASAQEPAPKKQRGLWERMVKPEMALPPELMVDVETLVGARLRTVRSPIGFGPYKVVKHRPGWDWGGSWDPPLPVTGGRVEEERKYSFVLEENKREVWNCACVTKWSAHHMNIAVAGVEVNLTKDQESSLECVIWRPDKGATWTLTFGPVFDPKITTESGYLGSLRTEGKGGYEVHWPKDASGYVFRTPDGAVAAADQLGQGHLVFRKSLTAEERELLAAAASALLIR